MKQLVIQEQPVCIADVLLRRTSLGWNVDQGRSAAGKVADIMAEVHGWDPMRRESEVERYERYLSETFGSLRFG